MVAMEPLKIGQWSGRIHPERMDGRGRICQLSSNQPWRWAGTRPWAVVRLSSLIGLALRVIPLRLFTCALAQIHSHSTD